MHAMASGKKACVLVVEDETVIAQDIRNSLVKRGHRVTGVVASGEDALLAVSRERPDIILMDIVLQGEMDGIQTAHRIGEDSSIPIIYLTAYTDDHMLERAKRTEPFGYLVKPFDDRELHVAVETALYKHRMEEKLREQTRFVETVLDSLTHPFYVIDANDYTIVMANRAANLGDLTEASTCHALTHRSAEPCHSLEHPCPLQMVKDTGLPVTVEHVHYDRDGRAREMEVHCYPILDRQSRVSRVIEYALDITEQRRLERQFAESQKMESIGRLASGVAHDFSNIMSAVLGYNEMAMAELPEDHPAKEKLRVVREAGERAAVLTHQLLAVSSRQELRMKPLRLDEVVREAATMLSRLIGDHITLDMRTAEAIRPVLADHGQLVQVLMNLSLNARDAMPRGGRLLIETSDVEVPAGQPGAGSDLSPAAHVMLAVSDTGHGIPLHLTGKIFEPFFTTKPPGTGTGLGLATVYGIVKQHGGHIAVESGPGGGTTFRIYLPAVSDGAIEPPSRVRETAKREDTR